MGRRPNTEHRREQIIQALAGELASVGYERCSIKSIAERAALAPGLVHYHFKSKAEILESLVAQLIERAEQRAGPIWTSDQPARQRLAEFIGARVGLSGHQAQTEVRLWTSLMGEAVGLPKVRTQINRWLTLEQRRLSMLFEQAGADNPDQHAATLLASILGAFQLSALKVAGVPRGYAEPQLLRWLDSVLGNL
ncbi:TetR/AcrR family transcriptional regulator [Pseudomarimonas arenosa]|uniref:TetR/AcrR family transcriptional regulator n=1 Tax=Pseudomarimonas arenosa TaxID=2774145 RepID=A0AAW3ZQ90_9GAMM|nr:TetR/AcrR family transcriptional regulator [Pseudomarimonas arenosa]MBD8527110.1 TetR/AcrR family transcriptional regulator [Pseudomarimonas arenosa]